MVVHRRVLLAGALLLLAGCASTADSPSVSESPSVTESPSATGSPSPTGNGTVFATAWDTEDGSMSIAAHPVGTQGDVSPGTPLLSASADGEKFPAVVDGRGEQVLTGDYSEYWTTDLQLRNTASGEVVREVKAPRWCGGDGQAQNLCVLLDDTRVARSTELGSEGVTEGSIMVSSLETGKDMATFGPFPGLTMMLGTGAADEVLLFNASTPPSDTGQQVPGTVLRLNTTDGATSELAGYPASWAPLCAIGSDSVLGYSLEGTPTSSMVGPAEVATFEWSNADLPVGCSADGRFLYVQRVSPLPNDQMDDTEAPNPSTPLDRIALADGTRTRVLVLDPGVQAGPVAR